MYSWSGSAKAYRNINPIREAIKKLIRHTRMSFFCIYAEFTNLMTNLKNYQSNNSRDVKEGSEEVQRKFITYFFSNDNS